MYNHFWEKKTILSYFLAILVFTIHISSLYNYTQFSDTRDFIKPLEWFVACVSRVAVPTFFILSGALFFRDYDNSVYVKKLKSRAKTLLIPYLLWNTIWMLFGVVTTLFFSDYFIGRPQSDLSPSGIFLSIVFHSDNLPFWFILNLIMFVILSPVIYELVRRRFVGIVSIISCLILCYFYGDKLKWLMLDTESIVYYMVGSYIGIHHFEWFSTASNKKIFLGSLGILACIILRTFVDVTRTNLIVWTILLSVYGICMLFAFDGVTRLFKKPLKEYLSHSFWVYALHLNASAIIAKVLFLILPKSIHFAWVNLFLTLFLTLFVIECIAQLLQRFCPPVYRLLSGGRG